jgi:hypothetical protein
MWVNRFRSIRKGFTRSSQRERLNLVSFVNYTTTEGRIVGGEALRVKLTTTMPNRASFICRLWERLNF